MFRRGWLLVDPPESRGEVGGEQAPGEVGQQAPGGEAVDRAEGGDGCDDQAIEEQDDEQGGERAVQAEEDRRPEGVDCELPAPDGQGATLAGPDVRCAPHAPCGDTHAEVKNGPDRGENPVRRGGRRVRQHGVPGADVGRRGGAFDRADQQNEHEKSEQRPDLGTVGPVLFGALGLAEDTFSFDREGFPLGSI